MLNKILDLPLIIDTRVISNLLQKEPQLSSLEFKERFLVESAIIKYLEDITLQIALSIDEDNTVSIDPLLFDNKVLVDNKGLILSNNRIEGSLGE